MTEQPDHLDIAVGLGFQAAAGAGTVQITVDVELQQISRRVARTTRRLRHRADKPKRREVQPVDKCLDEPHRIVSSDVIVNRLRQEEQLRTIVTGKVCHAGFYRTTKDVGIPHIEFSHSLADLCTNTGWYELPNGIAVKFKYILGGDGYNIFRIRADGPDEVFLTDDDS